MALAPILILGEKRIANLDELRATDDFEKLCGEGKTMLNCD